MVDTVEGLGVIREQDEVVFVLLNFAVVVLVDVEKVVGHPSSRKEHALVIAYELLGGVNDS